MSEQVRAVRAWAEYDEWSVLLDGIGRVMDNETDYFVSWEIPKGAEGTPQQVSGMLPLGYWVALMAYGSLRSLRVLLSNGCQVELMRKADSVTIPQGRRAVILEPGCMKFSLFAADGRWMCGGWYMPEVADTEAVRRALDAAIAWLAGERSGAERANA